jgi:hypothetical protein
MPAQFGIRQSHSRQLSADFIAHVDTAVWAVVGSGYAPQLARAASHPRERPDAEIEV